MIFNKILLPKVEYLVRNKNNITNKTEAEVPSDFYCKIFILIYLNTLSFIKFHSKSQCFIIYITNYSV